MGLVLPQQIEIQVAVNMAKYYENLGYEIPKKYNKRDHKWVYDRNATMKVDVRDLKPSSNLLLECECDICKEREKIPKSEYTRINGYVSKYGYDYLCLDCKFDVMPTAKLNVGTFKDNKEKIQKFLVRKLKSYVESNGYPQNKKLAFKPKNKMPTLRMYEEYLDGDLVDWLELCGYKLSNEEKYEMRTRGGQNKNYTKDDCISIIMNMQKHLDRPLEYKDFKYPTPDTLGVTHIKKYWGSVNKMKKELGLEIVQENMMDKQLTKDDFDKEVHYIVNFIKSDGRSFITTREINENSDWMSYGTLDRTCKKHYNIGLVQHLSSFGISFGKQGNGINYDFEDGEHVTSQFEYMFSRYLKEHGFKYQIDYFRDVKYSNFIDGYNGNMNCDYVIHIDDKIIYIEIAGIIADYKTWYYENKVISYSKSKEQYRVKLLEKETMLKNANLHYYILFPCDLTNNNFQDILSNDNLDLKNRIESFYKNNIDWNKVRNIGELDYSQNVIRDFKKYNEKQKEAV